MDRRHEAEAHPQDEWDSDLEDFVRLMYASFTLLQPSPDFEMGLRDRLVQAAVDLSAHPHRVVLPKGVLVGAAAAALSLVGAGAGAAAWWMWRTRPHHNGLTALLSARTN